MEYLIFPLDYLQVTDLQPLIHHFSPDSESYIRETLEFYPGTQRVNNCYSGWWILQLVQTYTYSIYSKYYELICKKLTIVTWYFCVLSVYVLYSSQIFVELVLECLTEPSHQFARVCLCVVQLLTTGWRQLQWLHWGVTVWLKGLHCTALGTHLRNTNTHKHTRCKTNLNSGIFGKLSSNSWQKLQWLFTWLWSLIGYRMVFADYLTAGSNTTKV